MKKQFYHFLSFLFIFRQEVGLEESKSKNEEELIDLQQNLQQNIVGEVKGSEQSELEAGKRKDSMYSSGDHQKKQNMISGRKCFNLLCNSKKIYKKIRSRVEVAKYRFLCKSCYQNYSNNSYCEFCEQIYSSYQNQEDDLKWIGCDRCERWNHIECQKYRNKNITEVRDKDFIYQCLSCSQKSRNNHTMTNQQHHKIKYKNQKIDEGKKYIKPRQQIKKQDRTLVFNKVLHNLASLQGFLQTYSYRLCINEGLIREDIDNLRNSHKKGQIQEKEKLKKIKLN